MRLQICVPRAPLHLCAAAPHDYRIQKMDRRSLGDAPRQPTYIGVCVESGKKQRERERVMWRSRGEPPLLDYVKHSHSPEVTALLWKLKVSPRFTAFVSRRLSHPLCGPAPTRYTPHGRLLWTTSATSAAGMFYLSARRGRLRRTGKGNNGVLVWLQIGSD